MEFSALTRTSGDGANYILGWLLEAWRKLWAMLSKVEMPKLSKEMVEERINRVRCAE